MRPVRDGGRAFTGVPAIVFGVAIALLVCAAVPAGGQIISRRATPARPAEAMIVTVRGENFPSQRGADGTMRRLDVLLETPFDLDNVDERETVYRFEAEGLAIGLEDVKAIVFRQETTLWIGSTAGTIEWYRLGPIGSAAPPPAGWARNVGGNPAWNRGMPVDPPPGAPFVQRAQSVWAAAPELRERSQGEFIARSPVAIGAVAGIERARLRVSSSAEIRGLKFNDRDVPVGALERGHIGVFEVTPLLREGGNVVGVWLRNDGPPATQRPWLVFHLELTFAAGAAAASPADAYHALVTTRDGWRAWADIIRFGSSELWLETAYGEMGVPWEGIRSLAFPRGWVELDEREGNAARRVLRTLGLADPPSLPPELAGAPYAFIPHEERQFVLTREGEVIEANAIQPIGEVLEIEGAGGGDSRIAKSAVAAIFPGAPEGSPDLERPTGPLAALFCRLRTTTGEEFQGVLRECSQRRVILEAEAGEFLRFDTGDVVWVWFPHHLFQGSPAGGAQTRAFGSGDPPTAANAPSLGRIGILGRAQGGTESNAARFEELNAELQAAAFLAGLPTATLSLEALTQPGALSPLLYPVLVSLDPAGEYLDTWSREGDIRRALLDYIEAGGTLLAYTRRGTLNLPILNMNGRLLRNVGGRNLAHELGLRSAAPGAAFSEVQAFHQPPNLPVTLLFERSESVPLGLRGLPETIYVPSTVNASFYPVIDEHADAEKIFELRNEEGRRFGPALSVHPRGQGRVVLIDHLLWESDVESQPFTRIVLPQMLQWTLQSARASAQPGIGPAR